MAAKGQGKAVKWLFAKSSYAGDDCIIWPFSTSNGYGMFGYLGETHYAHRFMCKLVNGPPPTALHEASHSCGRGHKGCITPRHLKWKTPRGNQLDRAAHGTKSNGWVGKITEEQAIEIRALRGILKQREIAERFGISRANVSLIQNGNTWRPDKYRRGIDSPPWLQRQ